MNDITTISNLLNKFSNDHKNISWKMNCSYSNGMGMTINEIKIIAQPGNRSIGIFTYRVQTGSVLFFNYNVLKNSRLSAGLNVDSSGKAGSENIVDILLDLMNYSKNHSVV